MRKTLKWLGWPLFGGVLYVLYRVVFAFAQTGPLWVNTTTTVSSSSVPVALITPGVYSSFSIHPRAASATGVQIWAYCCSTPTAVPTGTMEVSPGSYWGDTSNSTLTTSSQGWAAVLPSGSSTAITVDVVTR